MNPAIKTYFIRHGADWEIDDSFRQSLWTQRKIAIRFQDKRSLNPEDYATRAARTRRSVPPGRSRHAPQAHEADLVECVLGLGPNLFYNSPMEACVVICRSAKPKPRKGKILLINAVNEVTRERAQSFLTDDHIERIVKAYARFKDEPGFTRVATLEEIRAKDGNLSIPLYVAPAATGGTTTRSTVVSSPFLTETLAGWLEGSQRVKAIMDELLAQPPGSRKN